MIAIAVLVAQYAGTLDLLDTTRIGARSSETCSSGPGCSLPTLSNPRRAILVAADVSTMATARLRLSDRRWDYLLTYSPSVAATDVELGLDPAVIHAGSVGVTWHDRFVQVSASESGSYGQVPAALPFQTAPSAETPQNMGGPPPTGGMQTPPPTGGMQMTGQPLLLSATPANLTIGSTTTLGTAAVRASRFLTTSIAGGYMVSGGLTRESQAVVPEQFGPLGRATVAYAASPRDTFLTLASAQQTVTPDAQCVLQPVPPPPTPKLCRQEGPVATLQENIRHLFSPTESVTVGIGVGASTVQIANGQLDAAFLPIALATFLGRFGHLGASSYSISAALAPAVDIRTGLLVDRVQLNALLAEQITPRVRLSLIAGLLQSVPVPRKDPSPITAVNGGIEGRIRLNRQVDVIFGEQELWQNQPPYGTFLSSIGYVGATARSEALRF